MLHCNQTTTTELQDKCKDDASAKFCKKQKKKCGKKKKVDKKWEGKSAIKGERGRRLMANVINFKNFFYGLPHIIRLSYI